MSEKLQKVLARAGFGSRREMEKWIVAKRVTVNALVASLGDRVEPEDRIVVDGKKVDSSDKHRHQTQVILYNKPGDEICTRKDPQGRPTVYDKLPKLIRGRWVSIGRLDINTSGLLLFTNDGELANKLMHPASMIEREYAVRVLGDVTAEIIKAMHEGVMLEDGKARFTDIQHFAGSGVNQWYHVVIMAGRNREVRRLWESQGLKVSRLKRVRYGNIFVPSNITVGRYCYLSEKEIKQLYKLVELPYVAGKAGSGNLFRKSRVTAARRRH